MATLPAPSQPYGVTIHGEFIYWSDWVKNAVYRVDRFADNPLAEVVGEGVMLGMQGIVSSQIFEVGKQDVAIIAYYKIAHRSPSMHIGNILQIYPELIQ